MVPVSAHMIAESRPRGVSEPREHVDDVPVLKLPVPSDIADPQSQVGNGWACPESRTSTRARSKRHPLSPGALASPPLLRKVVALPRLRRDARCLAETV
jgi:hypothetical protein